MNLTTASFIRFFAVLIALVVLYVIRDVLLALFLAIIVASAMEPGVVWLKERRVPRILGVILIYLVAAALLFLAVYFIFPLVVEEIRNVSISFPALQTRLQSGINQVTALPLVAPFRENLQDLLKVPAEYLGKLGSGLFGFASNVFGGVFTFLLIIIFSFYLTAQERGIENFLRLVVPISQEAYVLDLWKRSQAKLGRWFRAQVLLGAVVGVFTFLGLTFLDIPQALFFSLLAAVFEVIPIVGPILSAIPAVAVALVISPLLGIFTVILYTAIQQVESHVIVPVVMKKAIGLNPLIVVLALLVGGKLGGILGILVSVPVTAIVVELLNDWDRHKRAVAGSG